MQIIDFETRKIGLQKELFYVLGALLGDGYLYRYKKCHIIGILVSEEAFARKFASKLSLSAGKEIHPHLYQKRNLWYVRLDNREFLELFEVVRKNPMKILEVASIENPRENSLQFIEGFFDAEGCVKLVKESARKTPKVCLDVTNTNCIYLEIVRRMLDKTLRIEARFSIQKPKSKNRRIAFHLRVYKKEFVKIFLENINTTKLREDKIQRVNNWLYGESKSDYLASSLNHPN